MAKTEATIELERAIWKATSKQGTFGCFEVTIGWFGKERVDYMTFNTKGNWHCYEVKVSKSDFYSKAAKSFVGHYNYFVIPQELYEEVKEDIPKHIGVYIGNFCVKKAKRQELGIDEDILKASMIRSLAREFNKQYKSGIQSEVDYLNRQISRHQTESDRYRRDYHDLTNKLYKKFGRNWQDFIEEQEE